MHLYRPAKNSPSGEPSKRKLFLIMRMTIVLLTVACLQVSAVGYSQKINLSVRQQSLEKVFREIKSQTGYVFWYKLDILQYAKKVTLRLQNQDLDSTSCVEKIQGYVTSVAVSVDEVELAQLSVLGPMV